MTHLLAILCVAAQAATLPPLDIAAGCYYSPGRCTYPLERRYFEDMRDAGCNTVTVQAHELPGNEGSPGTPAERIARQVNTACELGLADPRFAILCYSVGPQDVVDAQQHRKPGLQWPELVVQSIDEPNQTQEATLRQYQQDAHAAGIRIGTAVAGYNCTGYHQELPWCEPKDAGRWVPPIGQYLDMWVILVGTLSPRVRLQAERQGAEVWIYNAYPNNPQLDRWTYGVYAWRVRAKGVLAWAYIDKQAGWDYSRVTETPDGPQDRGLSGIAAGIMDHRVLQAVRDARTDEGRRWLRQLERQVPVGWWPAGYVREPEQQAAQVPTLDLDRVRAEGLELLERGRGRW